LHPALFELLARMAKVAENHDKEIVLFGEGAADPVRLPFFLGVGYRSFAIAPSKLRPMVETMRRFTASECKKVAQRVLEMPRALDVQRVLLPLAEKK
jgi:phosphotransferase system enzyme I (PtsP)